RLIAAAGHHGARLWTPLGAAGPELEDAPSGITCVAWSPKATTLAAACPDGTVRLWNAEGQPGPIMAAGSGSGGVVTLAWEADGTPSRVIRQEGGTITSIAWSPDSRSLAAGDLNNTVHLLRTHDQPEGAEALTGHTAHVLCVAWNPEGRRLASGGSDCTIRL